MDVALPGIPQNFGGVSGGGLWELFVYWSAATGEIAWAKDIEGVAFHQSDLANRHRVIRCHGPQSTGTAARLLVYLRLFNHLSRIFVLAQRYKLAMTKPISLRPFQKLNNGNQFGTHPYAFLHLLGV
jgi:hypothetical protein